LLGSPAELRTLWLNLLVEVGLPKRDGVGVAFGAVVIEGREGAGEVSRRTGDSGRCRPPEGRTFLPIGLCERPGPRDWLNLEAIPDAFKPPPVGLMGYEVAGATGGGSRLMALDSGRKMPEPGCAVVK